MTLEFAGDNPCVVLYDAEGAAISAISFWKADYSLTGTGQALFLVTSEAGRRTGRLFVEHKAPVDYFRSLNQHFLGFEPIDWASVQAEPATFEVGWKDDTYALACSHAGGRIDVAWRGFQKPQAIKQQSVDFGGEVGRSYDIASVIIGASEGTIHLDGNALPGSVTAPYGALPRSAFLAFCETWTRI